MNKDVQGHQFRCAVINLEKNHERPLDAVHLLREVADRIERAHEHDSALTYPLQPFIIKDIVIDLYDGTASIYYYNQSKSD